MRLRPVFALVLLLAATLPGAARAEDRSDNMHLIGSVELPGATDVEFTKDGYAVVAVNGSGQMAGLWIVDVRDPHKPKTLGHLPCAGSGYDLDVHKDVAVMSSDSASGNASGPEQGCNVDGTQGQEGIRLVDISNRKQPKEIGFVVTPCGSHTNFVVAKGKNAYVYVQSYPVSTSGLCASLHGIISVVDITNPNKAEIVAQPSTSPAVGCHDGSVKGNIAYMACLTEGQIWDISNPLEPEVVAHIRDAPDAIWHSSAISNDGKIAAFGFESFGPGNVSCNGTGQGLGGAIWFYDVSDPTAPDQLGHFVPPRLIQGLCTAHNFTVIPKIEKDILVTAWYAGGTMVVDFTDPNNPVEFAHYVPDSTSTWHGNWYRGYAFVGDGNRGLDIFAIDELSPNDHRH